MSGGTAQGESGPGVGSRGLGVLGLGAGACCVESTHGVEPAHRLLSGGGCALGDRGGVVPAPLGLGDERREVVLKGDLEAGEVLLEIVAAECAQGVR